MIARPPSLLQRVLQSAGVTPLRNQRVQLYHSIRTAHLERASDLGPVSILYRVRSYDFDQDLADRLEVVRAGTLKSVLLLLRSRPGSLEVNEPLMAESAVHTAAVLFFVRMLTPARKRPVVGSYAIENQDPFVLPRLTLKARTKGWLQSRSAGYVWRILDRLAFGTAGAEAVYLARFPPGRRDEPVTTTIPALPAACACEVEAGGQDVVFLGALSERKGFPVVQASWDDVLAADPAASVTVLGKGPLEEEAERWSRSGKNVTFVEDPPRSVIHEVLRGAKVLILPSQPSPTWREQVGLPIVEGLAHGCRIITTSQTGLADWLIQEGHSVLDAQASPADFARAILAQRGIPRGRQSDLPAVDGRLAADQWLFGA